MRKIVFGLLRLSGIHFLFREFIQRNKVTILLFHDISKESAERTFTFLSEKYNIIALDDYIDAVKNQTPLPKKAMIITFDDGHVRNYEMLSVIKKLNIPVTIFLCASIINTNRHYWFLYKNSGISKSKLKKKSNRDKLEILSKSGFETDKEYDTPQALQKMHIDEMRPYVNFQSHTLFHPILPKCGDEQAWEEIFYSKEILEKEYGFKINTLSYPNGDYSERDIQLAKKANYECGITVDYGYNTLKTDLFRLKRFCANDTEDINELIIKATGAWSYLRAGFGIRQGFGFIDKTEK